MSDTYIVIRLVLGLVLATACTSAQAPIARRTGMVLSIGGTVGLTASAAASHIAETDDLVLGFSVISAIGIGLFAAGELSDPKVLVIGETTEQKHQRWARILTERAFRYAREGNCKRVRRVEKRVNFYDRALRDGVFMRDPEIAKCMSRLIDPPSELPLAEPGAPVESTAESPSEPNAGPPPRVLPPPVLPPPVLHDSATPP